MFSGQTNPFGSNQSNNSLFGSIPFGNNQINQSNKNTESAFLGLFHQEKQENKYLFMKVELTAENLLILKNETLKKREIEDLKKHAETTKILFDEYYKNKLPTPPYYTYVKCIYDQTIELCLEKLSNEEL